MEDLICKCRRCGYQRVLFQNSHFGGTIGTTALSVPIVAVGVEVNDVK